MPPPKRNRDLTPEAFGKFLRWLSADDEQAVQEYQTIRKKLVRYFIHKGCADPDRLFDRVIDIIVGKIEACGECSNPLAYSYGVARNVWREDIREPKSVELVPEFHSGKYFDEGTHELELKCLDGCMNQLSPNDRDVVVRYHQSQGHDKIETRRLLADGFGGVNALRIKMCRIRRDLRACIVDCTKRSIN
jgi:hypothetical protein